MEVKATAGGEWVALTEALGIELTDRYAWTLTEATLADRPELAALLGAPVDVRVTLTGAARSRSVRALTSVGLKRTLGI